jgi:hypothetical protein
MTDWTLTERRWLVHLAREAALVWHYCGTDQLFALLLAVFLILDWMLRQRE